MVYRKSTITVPMLIIGAVIIVMISSCTSKKKEFVHPEKTNLPSIEETDHMVDLGMPNPDSLSQLSFLENSSLNYSIGANADINSKYYYESITNNVELDTLNNLYLIQHHTNSIMVYDKSGKFIYSIGGSGKGPGEFVQLITFVFDKNYQTLYALDRLEIEIYKLNNGRYQYSKTIPHSFLRVFDMCLLDESLFISGYKFSSSDTTDYPSDLHRRIQAKVSPPITQFNLSTMKPKISFGFEYETEYGYGSHEGFISRMLLSCNSTTKTIVGYQKDLPFIFGYDKTGKIRWTSKINGLKMAQHTEFIDSKSNLPGLMFRTQKGQYFYKNPIPTFKFKHFEILQLHKASPTQSPINFDPDLVVKNLKFKTVLVNTKTGALFYSDAYPRIELVKNNIYVTTNRDPDTFQRTFFIHKYE